MTDHCRHDLPRVVLLTGDAAARGPLGAMLAEKFGCPFYDLDDLAEVVHEHREGAYLPAGQIVQTRGAEHFATLQWQAAIELLNLLERQDAPAVVAAGEDIRGNERAWHVLRHLGPKVRLEAGETPLPADDPPDARLDLRGVNLNDPPARAAALDALRRAIEQGKTE